MTKAKSAGAVKAPAPEETIHVTLGGETKELFMSFGMLNEISAAIADVENIPMIHVDVNTRARVLNVIFAERDESGRITKPLNLMEFKMSTTDVHRVLDWASENAMDFFMKSLEATKALTEKHGPRVSSLMSSLDGTAS